MSENAALYGTWESYRCENMAEVMEKAGAPVLAKKLSTEANGSMTITKVDDKVIRIGSHTSAFSIDQDVEIGGIRKFKPPQGEEQEFTAEWHDGKLVVFAGPPGSDLRAPGSIRQTREVLDNGELLLSMEVGGVVGHRWFKKH